MFWEFGLLIRRRAASDFFSPFSGVKNGESKSHSPSLFSNASTIAVSPYQVSQVRRQRVLAQAQLGLQPEIVF